MTSPLRHSPGSASQRVRASAHAVITANAAWKEGNVTRPSMVPRIDRAHGARAQRLEVGEMPDAGVGADAGAQRRRRV